MPLRVVTLTMMLAGVCGMSLSSSAGAAEVARSSFGKLPDGRPVELIIGKSGRGYRQGDALVLEPELPPDLPNQPQLGSARLEPGATYRNVIVYRLFVSAARTVMRRHSQEISL